MSSCMDYSGQGWSKVEQYDHASSYQLLPSLPPPTFSCIEQNKLGFKRPVIKAIYTVYTELYIQYIQYVHVVWLANILSASLPWLVRQNVDCSEMLNGNSDEWVLKNSIYNYSIVNTFNIIFIQHVTLKQTQQSGMIYIF